MAQHLAMLLTATGLFNLCLEKSVHLNAGGKYKIVNKQVLNTATPCHMRQLEE